MKVGGGWDGQDRGTWASPRPKSLLDPSGMACATIRFQSASAEIRVPLAVEGRDTCQVRGCGARAAARPESASAPTAVYRNAQGQHHDEGTDFIKLGTRKRRNLAVAIDSGHSHDRPARRGVVDGSERANGRLLPFPAAATIKLPEASSRWAIRS